MASYPPAVKSTIPFMFTFKCGVDNRVLLLTRRCCNGDSPTEIAKALAEYHHSTYKSSMAAYYRQASAMRAPAPAGQRSVQAVFGAALPVRLAC